MKEKNLLQYLIETPTPKIHSSNEIIGSDFNVVKTKENKCTIEYYNIPCAFDIETTTSGLLISI